MTPRTTGTDGFFRRTSRRGWTLRLKRRRNSPIAPQSRPNFSAMIRVCGTRGFVSGFSHMLVGAARDRCSMPARRARIGQSGRHARRARAFRLHQRRATARLAGRHSTGVDRRLFDLSREFLARGDLPVASRQHHRHARQEGRRLDLAHAGAARRRGFRARLRRGRCRGRRRIQDACSRANGRLRRRAERARKARRTSQVARRPRVAENVEAKPDAPKKSKPPSPVAAKADREKAAQAAKPAETVIARRDSDAVDVNRVASVREALRESASRPIAETGGRTGGADAASDRGAKPAEARSATNTAARVREPAIPIPPAPIPSADSQRPTSNDH